MGNRIPIPLKLLIIGNIKKGDAILMRKKFVGSKPYTETWYLFGCDFVSGEEPMAIFVNFIKGSIGIDVAPVKSLFWDFEVKEDTDGVQKQFIYLDAEFEYVSGEIIVPEGLEKVEWAPINQLQNFDIVPPSIKLFKKLQYLN
jgi:hypothetical protein